MEEWDSVCQYMTQRVRNSIIEGKVENTDEETQSLSGESSHAELERERLEDDCLDAGTGGEHLSFDGRAQCDNSSDKENNSPSESRNSPLAPLKPIPCFALLEQSCSLPLAPASPSNSSATPCASLNFLSVPGNTLSAGLGERSFSSPQATKSCSSSAPQLACPPSPDMFESEGEEEETTKESKVEEEEGDSKQAAKR